MIPKIEIIEGDITKLSVDAIVNAANKSLLGGGGVDGAIHEIAGPKLLKECESLNGCRVGEAKITLGYDLPSKYVIHTVGPIWDNQPKEDSEMLLEDCYINSLKLADENNLATIAFPAISTGVYGFPKTDAVKIVRRSLEDYFLVIQPKSSIKIVTLVAFSDEDKTMYDKTLSDLLDNAEEV